MKRQGRAHSWARVAVGFVSLLWGACGDDKDKGANGEDTDAQVGSAQGDDAADGGLDGGGADRSDAGGGGRDPRPRDAGSPASDSGFTAEVCDGIDNDGDGISDNVDVGGDGVCDCLLLATLGVRGNYGNGDIFADWLDRRSNNGAASLHGKTLTPELLAPYQVIVVQDIRDVAYSDAELAALHDWIRQGGGLFTMLGYHETAEPPEWAHINRLLQPVGIQYGDVWVFNSVGKTMPIGGWDATHPVSAGVTQLGAAFGYEVRGGGTALAQQDGVVALRVAELGEGRVIAFTDEWITYDSEWVEHPEYQVERFWLNAIKWLSPPKECQVAIPNVI